MNIERFCEINDLGIVTNITKLTGGLMHKMFKVEKRCFTSKELCRNKKHLFKNKIGKVKVI